jgi:predicted aldo/keto reductase-like oxidoreductase
VLASINHCQDPTAMKYKMLGRTGLFVSEICLGTMTFGGRGELWPIIGQLDQAAANSLLRLSIEAGINSSIQPTSIPRASRSEFSAARSRILGSPGRI